MLASRGTDPAVRILAVEQLCAVWRERGKGFAECRARIFQIDASRRDQVFGHGLSERTLVNHVCAVGRPARSPRGSLHDVHGAEVRVPDLDTFVGGGGAPNRIANSAAGQKLRRQLGLVGCGVQRPLPLVTSTDTNSVRERAALGHVHPDLVGFVKEDRPTVWRRRRAARDTTRPGDSAQAGSVWVHDIDTGRTAGAPSMTRIHGCRAFTIGAKGNPVAVGRPCRTEVAALGFRQVGVFLGGKIEQPEIGCARPARRNEGERAPVG